MTRFAHIDNILMFLILLSCWFSLLIWRSLNLSPLLFWWTVNDFLRSVYFSFCYSAFSSSTCSIAATIWHFLYCFRFLILFLCFLVGFFCKGLAFPPNSSVFRLVTVVLFLIRVPVAFTLWSYSSARFPFRFSPSIVYSVCFLFAYNRTQLPFTVLFRISSVFLALIAF